MYRTNGFGPETGPVHTNKRVWAGFRVRFALPCGKQKSMKARVHITLKNGVLDPQGKAIKHALGGLGFSGINDVRQGKYIELDLGETDEAAARAAVEAMCEKLLANTVIENYEIDLDA